VTLNTTAHLEVVKHGNADTAYLRCWICLPYLNCLASPVP